jgi:hypothetical protein
VLERGGRRYLCLAHEQPPANFSVLDVTDPRAPRLLTQTRLSHGAIRSNSLAVGDDLLLVAYQVQTPGTQDGDDAPLPVRHERFDTRFRAQHQPSCPTPAPGLCRLPRRGGHHPGRLRT